MRPGGRRVNPWLMGSLGCAWGVVGLILGLWVPLSTPLVSLDLSEITGFNGVPHSVRRVHPGSLDSLGCTLVAVGFIRGRWVHWGAPWWSSCSSVVAWVRSSDRLVHPGWLCSLACALGFVGFIRGRGVHYGAH